MLTKTLKIANALGLILLLSAWWACQNSPTDSQSSSRRGLAEVADPTPSPTSSPGPSPSPSASPAPSPSPTTSPSPSPSPTPAETPSPEPSPSATPAPGEFPFQVLFIEKARVELDRDLGDQRFEVEGRFVLDSASDGVNVLNEEVTIVFDGFTAVLPPGSFHRDDDGFEFELEERENGLKEVKIRPDGRFEVEGKDIALGSIDLSQPVFFSLRIGNDVGETEIPFDNDGRFENPNPFPSPSPSPTPTETPTPEPTPSVSPSPSPSPTPAETPSPEPSPSVSPSPSPSPTGSPSPEPSPSATPELHVRGPIQQLVVRGAKDGDVTVQNIVFQVSSSTELEDDDGKNVTLDHFKLGEEVDAWGPPAVGGKTPAKRIRAR